MDDDRTGSDFAKAFLSKLIGFSISTWISFGLSFISVPIVTRLFAPEEVGKINLFGTYLTLFSLVALFGLDQSFIRFFNEPPSKNNKNGLMIICLLFGVIASIMIITFLFLFYQKISIEISGQISIIIPLCLGLSLFANLFVKYIGLYYRMDNNVLLYSIQAIAFAFISKILHIVVAIKDPTHIGAIIVQTIGYCILAVLFSIISYRNILKSREECKLYFDKETVTELMKFGIPLLPVTMLSWLNNSISQLLLKRFVSFSAIGIYTNAVAVAGLMGLIQVGFNTYWIPFLYSNYQTERSNIAKIHRMVTYAMSLFGLLIILGQDLLYLFIGTNFRDSKVFFPLLLLSPICYTIGDTTGMGIEIAKKNYFHIVIFSISVGFNLLISVILLPQIGVMGAAIAAALTSILRLTIQTFIGQGYYRMVDDYRKMIVAIITISIAAILNIVLIDSLLFRTVCIALLIVLLSVFNKRELAYGLRFVRGILSFRRNAR